MKLIPALLIVGMFAVSGWAEEEQVPDFADLVKRAESGDATAQWELGCWYQLGTRVGKDEKEAVKWFIKSAKQGFAKAQALLGGCYERGKGVVKDEKEAVKWYTKAAEQEDERAKKALEKLKSK